MKDKLIAVWEILKTYIVLPLASIAFLTVMVKVIYLLVKYIWNLI